MHTLSLQVPIDVAYDQNLLDKAIRERLALSSDDPLYFRLLKRSLDARRHPLKSNLRVAIFDTQSDFHKGFPPELSLKSLSSTAPTVIIVGAGPAGLFAALRLISLGVKPIIFERGQSVRTRRRSLAALNRSGIVDRDSNYCFGEGGAGTYSDGKLYTRSKKRGAVRAVLQILVDHGAPAEILFEAQPHIGTNRLPKVIEAMRDTIIARGGEVHFGSKVVDLITDVTSGTRTLQGIILSNGEERLATAGVILATGHSARDVFELLHRSEIDVEAKPFALGVRVEHPQELIDQIQYHGQRPPQLGSAAYKLVTQADQRGVFSFCMCPGGIIAPAATAPGEIVVNGWSPYKRNGKFANSGIVVTVGEDDFSQHSTLQDPLAGLRYQSQIERKAFTVAGSKGLIAPAQRLSDFIRRRPSASLPSCSYVPGLASVALNEVLPADVERRLITGFKHFGERLNGYLHPDAVVVGVESRTSSPVRIPRDQETLQHPKLARLFPCGEGAGYAGGIVSAALDGFRCAEAAAQTGMVALDEWANTLVVYQRERGGISS